MVIPCYTNEIVDGYPVIQWNDDILAYLNYSRKKELRVVTHQAARKTRQITWLCPKVKGHSRPNYNLFGSDGWDVGDIPPHVDLVDEVEAFETLHPHSSEIDSNALGLCPAKDPKIVFFLARLWHLGKPLGEAPSIPALFSAMWQVATRNSYGPYQMDPNGCQTIGSQLIRISC